MAPRGVPLLDHPEDCWPNDRRYPQLEGQNFTKGWSEYSGKQRGDDDSELSDLDDKIRQIEEREKRKLKQRNAVVKTKPVPESTDPLSSAPSTLNARKASSALGSRTGDIPNFAAPTAAARARAPGILASKKPLTGPSAVANPRHAAARVVSNTTLGYSKGRSVSAAARKPLGDVHVKEEGTASEVKMPFGGGTTLDMLLGLSLEEKEGDDELGVGVSTKGLGEGNEDEDALADFQLGAPEFSE
jgi:hypothetical protein